MTNPILALTHQQLDMLENLASLYEETTKLREQLLGKSEDVSKQAAAELLAETYQTAFDLFENFLRQQFEKQNLENSRTIDYSAAAKFH